MRLAPLNGLVGSLIDFSASEDYTTTAGGTSGFTGIAPGTIIMATPTDGIDTSDADIPNWGMAELMYVVNTGSSTFAPGRVVQIDKNYAIADMPNTAGTGKPVYVCVTSFTAGNVTTQGGWVMSRGICPVSFSVAATTGLVYFGAAGQFSPTQTNSKQILGAATLIAAAGSFTRSVTAKNGSTRLFVGRVNGLYPGMAISTAGNTPVPTSTTISSIDPDGQSIVISNAAVASATATATFTHTNFGICHIDRPFVQGQVL